MTEAFYDVVVIGAGMAGFAAAMGAARGGVSVLLLDQSSGPGGVAVDGGCPSLMGFGESGRQIVGGIGDELVRRLDDVGYARQIEPQSGCPESEPIGTRPIVRTVITDSHYLRCELDAMLREAGVTRRYYSFFSRLECDGRRIVRIIVADGMGGETGFRVGTVIDATGTAAVAVAAGVECLVPNPEDAMTKTVMFRVSQVVDFDKRTVRQRFAELLAAGKVPLAGQDRLMGSATLEPGEVLINLTLVAGNALNATELTRMDSELRDQISMTVAWLRQEFAEFRSCRLTATAPRIGVRIYRTAVGREIIRCAELDAQTPVAEPVAVGPVTYGGHGLNKFSNSWDVSRPGVRAIPMGSLIARDVENLLLAGRIISAEPRAVSSIRLMGTCLATGQAAGVLAARGGAAASYAEVRRELLRQNAILA